MTSLGCVLLSSSITLLADIDMPTMPTLFVFITYINLIDPIDRTDSYPRGFVREPDTAIAPWEMLSCAVCYKLV